MATLTKEQVEQKLQQLKQLTEEMNALTKELAEAGDIELSDEELEKVSGGKVYRKIELIGEPGTSSHPSSFKFVITPIYDPTVEPVAIPEPKMQ